MIGYFEVEPGNRSMGRLLAFIAMVVGATISLAGVVVFIYLAVSAPVERAPYVAQAIALVGIGAGLSGSGEFLKAAQKKREG